MNLQLHYYDVLESTNITAVDAAMHGAAEGYVIIAEKQCSASGRMGRVWNSPIGGLWFSIILRPHINPENVAQLTLLSGVAVVKALRCIYETEQVKIKWPNDVLLEGKKICGILSEMKLDENGMVDYAILGIGINVNLLQSDFSEELQNIASSLLLSTGKYIGCDEVLQKVLQEITCLYEDWLEHGPESLFAQWKQYSCTLGKKVLVKDNDRIIFSGTAVDMGAQGSLLVRNEEGIQRSFDFGEISIR